MDILDLKGVSVKGIYSCLPATSEDNLVRCTEVYGDSKKALSVVKATGIRSRRIVTPGISSLDLCCTAAESLLADYAMSLSCTLGDVKQSIGAVLDVTFTPERTMPCNACQAQQRLGLPQNLMAFDINLACSGWAYGLYVAGVLANSTGKMVLLLDGDTQTTHMDVGDVATVPVMADAGTATLIAPSEAANPWKFAFLTDGTKGDALTLPFGGTISMDGLGIFKFVTMDVLRFLQEFLAKTEQTPEKIDAFVPHQANVFMIQQIAKKLKFPPEKLWVSGDVFGNSSSATIPTTIAHCGKSKGGDRVLLVAGFGGGLSASVGLITLPSDCGLMVFDYAK